jgi:hypothetical protein
MIESVELRVENFKGNRESRAINCCWLDDLF